jgi:protoporphyrinogen/coproporphyrinogen III oxidase
MFSAMNRTALVSSVLVLVATLTTGCVTEGEADLAPGESLDTDDTDVAEEARARPKPNPSIAIIGAGPSGLTAALRLKELGYTNVTVFEKENRVGGKVNTLNSNGLSAELGAVFASPDYTTVLELASARGIPVAEYTVPRFTYDGGVKRTPQQFLASRYTQTQIENAVAAYRLVLRDYPEVDGFDRLPRELLNQSFRNFAAAKGFTPIAELARSIIAGFGYCCYEDMPAAYGMKILPWLVKVNEAGLAQPTYYTFPTGFQSLWTAVASELNVRLSSPVVNVDREYDDDRKVWTSDVTINVGADTDPTNDVTETFDRVIFTIPLNRVAGILEETSYEQYLFSKVDTDQYYVSLFTSPNLTRGETVFVHDTAQASGINHLNAWGNRDTTSPIFIGYQLVDDSITPANIVATLAADVASLGQAVFGSVLFQKAWPDYFPSVSLAHSPFFFQSVESLQGAAGVYYVGGTLAFETVEHNARYAKRKINGWFPARN